MILIDVRLSYILSVPVTSNISLNENGSIDSSLIILKYNAKLMIEPAGPFMLLLK